MAIQITESLRVQYELGYEWYRSPQRFQDALDDSLPKGLFLIRHPFHVLNCLNCRSSSMVKRRRNSMVKFCHKSTWITRSTSLQIFYEWKSFVPNVTSYVPNQSSFGGKIALQRFSTPFVCSYAFPQLNRCLLLSFV